jgi:hypothetical protein
LPFLRSLLKKAVNVAQKTSKIRCFSKPPQKASSKVNSFFISREVKKVTYFMDMERV